MGRNMDRRLGFLPQIDFFYLKWRVLLNSKRYLCPCPRQKKNVELFSAWSWDLVYIDGGIEYAVRVIELVSFLPHCEFVMQAIWCLKLWNITKSGGTICISVSHSKFWGICFSWPPVIYVYAGDRWDVWRKREGTEMRDGRRRGPIPHTPKSGDAIRPDILTCAKTWRLASLI